MTATQIKNVRAWHEELLEFMLANPRATTMETAMYFNVSMSWVSIVKNTDAFRELWAARRGEHFSRVSAGVSERVTALAEMSVEALTDKLEKEIKSDTGATISTLQEVSEMALKSLGFGSKVGPAPSMQVNNTQNNIFVDKETLAKARAARAAIQAQEPPLQLEVKKIERDDV